MWPFTSVTYAPPQVTKLPWNEEEISAETQVLIEMGIINLNKKGVLTINSQPAVNGEPSNSPAVGWGAPNGYVYQKVRLEGGNQQKSLYFVSPRERPWRQRVVQNNTLVIARVTSVFSHTFKKESRDWHTNDAFCNVYHSTRWVT